MSVLTYMVEPEAAGMVVTWIAVLFLRLSGVLQSEQVSASSSLSSRS